MDSFLEDLIGEIGNLITGFGWDECLGTTTLTYHGSPVGSVKTRPVPPPPGGGPWSTEYSCKAFDGDTQLLHETFVEPNELWFDYNPMDKAKSIVINAVKAHFKTHGYPLK